MILNLEDKDVVLIGAGREGLWKARTLLSFGANLTVIAPQVEQELMDLEKAYPGRLYFALKEFEETDLIPLELQGPDHAAARDQALQDLAAVVAATDDQAVNERVSQICHQYRIPVNIVDQTHLSTFFFPSILREGDVVCAFSSNGKSPLVTKMLRDRLRDVLPDKIGEINDRMGELRSLVSDIHDRGLRIQIFRKMLSMLMAADDPSDVTDEMVQRMIGKLQSEKS